MMKSVRRVYKSFMDVAILIACNAKTYELH